MTVISLLTAADVVVLRCIYFQLVKSLKEIDWYGIDCNTQEYIDNIELGFIYLEAITHACDLTHAFQCEIKTYITRKSSFCVFDDDRCSPKYTITDLGVVG